MVGTIPRLQIIQSRAQLANEIGVPVALLTKRAFEMDQSHLYSSQFIRKRSGGVRLINAPFWPLANIQRRLLTLLNEIYRPSSRVMGFVPDRGIRKNALFHVGKRLILNVDLLDFFSSIHAGRIRRRLMARPYSLTDDVATTIAKLCTLNDRLPTGAPTSPVLSNIVMSSLDGALTSFARENGSFYTRYADDLTFSTNRAHFPQAMVRRLDGDVASISVGVALGELIQEHGFQVQPSKTRVMNRDMRQEVCGVTCNSRLNVRRSFYREVRGAINAWRAYGRELAEERWNKKYSWRQGQDLERHLRGRIEHLIHIRGQGDKPTANIVKQYNELGERLFKDVYYDYEERDPQGVLRSVVLIECADESDLKNLQYTQGTGFVVEGGAVVTNHHVVSYRRYTKKGKLRKNRKGEILPKIIFPQIRVRFEGESVEYDMAVVYADAAKDIAVLRPVEPWWNAIFASRAAEVAFGEPKVGAAVSLIGYPNHSHGGSIKVVPTVITGTTPLEGQPYFTVAQIIVQGNSGGPVVDENGQVIGIATKGIAPNEQINLAFNGCIPMYTVDPMIFTSS